MESFILPIEKQNNSFEVRKSMIEYLKTIGIIDGNCEGLVTFTKKEVYTAIGMNKPTQAFNSVWAYLPKDRFGAFMCYDKEIKKWIWL